MDPSTFVADLKKKVQVSVDHFSDELKKIRTGRASASMLDGTLVEAYGTTMPINQVATITAPEATLIQVTPFDANNLIAIVEAIRKNQTLGLNPMDDGRVVRLQIPPLTEERRREIAKQVGEKVEDCMISLRNHRHEVLKLADSALKDKKITKDDYDSVEKQINSLITEQKNKTESLTKSKETEIMTL
ncbi:MAG TPA: ribosome recycling factor [Candidatus Saccharimonadales bacterium]|jgi:ribosome recycling factor|nr:ribosome recycling factor [Candidatus Saccharimonadales bacterium]